MYLENEKIKLRAVEPEDLDLLYDWENKPELWSVGNTRQPYSRFALKQYISQVDQNIYESGQLRLMIQEKAEGKTVGTVDLFDLDLYNGRIALGLFVDKVWQGKGFAKEALHLTEDYVFGFLKLHQLYCHISEKNTASRRLFEKEQYEANGILKNWIKTSEGYENIIVFQRFFQP
ncbi:MAG: GNAT family N-acetyltransferase [Paludibacter sp.]|nr:GNAT family N-acetyltransferase [Paludibacter sp.]